MGTSSCHLYLGNILTEVKVVPERRTSFLHFGHFKDCTSKQQCYLSNSFDIKPLTSALKNYYSVHILHLLYCSKMNNAAL